jgi:enoyl-CoA hydratase/carnithine racemase
MEDHMEYKTITLENKDYISTITLNKPPQNSVNMLMREDLDQVFKALENDKNTRIIIITGAGEKGFCSGMDVGDAANYNSGPHAQDVFNRIDRYPKPVIAMINGYCLGGGLELALACHWRFMVDAPKAMVGFPEVNLGITPGWGGLQRAARLLGRGKAMDFIFTCKRISAPEALQLGLIDRVSKQGELVKDTYEYASMIARKAPLAISAIMQGMIKGLEDGIDEGQKLDRQFSDKLARSKDAIEGFTAFAEKREPVFRGE